MVRPRRTRDELMAALYENARDYVFSRTAFEYDSASRRHVKCVALRRLATACRELCKLDGIEIREPRQRKQGRRRRMVETPLTKQVIEDVVTNADAARAEASKPVPERKYAARVKEDDDVPF